MSKISALLIRSNSLCFMWHHPASYAASSRHRPGRGISTPADRANRLCFIDLGQPRGPLSLRSEGEEPQAQPGPVGVLPLLLSACSAPYLAARRRAGRKQ